MEQEVDKIELATQLENETKESKHLLLTIRVPFNTEYSDNIFVKPVNFEEDDKVPFHTWVRLLSDMDELKDTIKRDHPTEYTVYEVLKKINITPGTKLELNKDEIEKRFERGDYD